MEVLPFHHSTRGLLSLPTAMSRGTQSAKGPLSAAASGVVPATLSVQIEALPSTLAQRMRGLLSRPTST